MRPVYSVRFICLAALLLASDHLLYAEEQNDPDDAEELDRIYMTPEERREAGLKHSITDWLTVSGLVEAEYFYYRFSHPQSIKASSEHESSETIQLGIELTPLPWIKSELIYEYDIEPNQHTIDEFIVSIEQDDLELAVGKIYLPFGEYFSHFATGPLIEFGETREISAILAYNIDDRLDISAFLYEGQRIKNASTETEINHGFAIEASPFDLGLFGASYLSDLGESEAELLADLDEVNINKVAGLNAYMAISSDRYSISGEIVHALGSFKGLDADRNRPAAWNIELAYYPAGLFDWALRLEGSRELEDAPRLQGGASVTWRMLKTMSLTLEYLNGTFEKGLAVDSNDVEVTHVNQIGGQISLLF